MKKVMFIVLCLLLAGCKTIDVEKKMIEEDEKEALIEKKRLEEEEKKIPDTRIFNDDDLKKGAVAVEEVEDCDDGDQVVEKRQRVFTDEYTFDIEPVVIRSKEYIVVDRKDVPVKGRDAVSQSLKESFVELEDYVKGTSFFDYDENAQYPVFTKKLSMTTIILNDDEMMAEGSVPFMSDTTRWEITGDVWETSEGVRQLIMIKPKENNLETNMLVVTNKRLYHFVLYSTSKDYQPMVRFRYPYMGKFNTVPAKKSAQVISQDTIYRNIDPELLSFNYTISTANRKCDWIPTKVYDDGSHTYILFPEIVLQREIPAVWEGKDMLTNYEFDPKFHNLLIINKLCKKLTLKLGKEKVTVKKKKGNVAYISSNRTF